jgi:hypothetical protein
MAADRDTDFAVVEDMADTVAVAAAEDIAAAVAGTVVGTDQAADIAAPDMAGSDPDMAGLEVAESARTVYRRRNKLSSCRHWAYYSLYNTSLLFSLLFLNWNDVPSEIKAFVSV